MEVLGIAASVAGLLCAVPKVYNLINHVASSIKGQPDEIVEAEYEVKAFYLALQSIERILLQVESADLRRTRLVPLESLAITLTAAVMTVSKLENLLKNISSAGRWKGTSLWEGRRGQPGVKELLSRIQRHESSFTLMLNILQSESDLEASIKQNLLHLSVSLDVEGDQELQKKVGSWEDAIDVRSAFSRRLCLDDVRDGSLPTRRSTRRQPYSRPTSWGSVSNRRPQCVGPSPRGSLARQRRGQGFFNGEGSAFDDETPCRNGSNIHLRQSLSAPENEVIAFNDQSTSQSFGESSSRRCSVTIQRKSLIGAEGNCSSWHDTLLRSRVYRRYGEGNTYDRSSIGSAALSMRWSVLSGFSMADISVLSVVCLPLTAENITNPEHYRFGRQLATEIVDDVGGCLGTPSRTSMLGAAIPEAPGQPGPPLQLLPEQPAAVDPESNSEQLELFLHGIKPISQPSPPQREQQHAGIAQSSPVRIPDYGGLQVVPFELDGSYHLLPVPKSKIMNPASKHQRPVESEWVVKRLKLVQNNRPSALEIHLQMGPERDRVPMRYPPIMPAKPQRRHAVRISRRSLHPIPASRHELHANSLILPAELGLSMPVSLVECRGGSPFASQHSEAKSANHFPTTARRQIELTRRNTHPELNSRSGAPRTEPYTTIRVQFGLTRRHSCSEPSSRRGTSGTERSTASNPGLGAQHRVDSQSPQVETPWSELEELLLKGRDPELWPASFGSELKALSHATDLETVCNSGEKAAVCSIQGNVSEAISQETLDDTPEKVLGALPRQGSNALSQETPKAVQGMPTDRPEHTPEDMSGSASKDGPKMILDANPVIQQGHISSSSEAERAGSNRTRNDLIRTDEANKPAGLPVSENATSEHAGKKQNHGQTTTATRDRSDPEETLSNYQPNSVADSPVEAAPQDGAEIAANSLAASHKPTTGSVTGELIRISDEDTAHADSALEACASALVEQPVEALENPTPEAPADVVPESEIVAPSRLPTPRDSVGAITQEDEAKREAPMHNPAPALGDAATQVTQLIGSVRMMVAELETQVAAAKATATKLALGRPRLDEEEDVQIPIVLKPYSTKASWFVSRFIVFGALTLTTYFPIFVLRVSSQAAEADGACEDSP